MCVTCFVCSAHPGATAVKRHWVRQAVSLEAALLSQGRGRSRAQTFLMLLLSICRRRKRQRASASGLLLLWFCFYFLNCIELEKGNVSISSCDSCVGLKYFHQLSLNICLNLCEREREREVDTTTKRLMEKTRPKSHNKMLASSESNARPTISYKNKKYP